MKEAVVEQEVKTYFTDRFPQFSVSRQRRVQFGTRKGGIADVVLHQSTRNGDGYYVAIAECKKWPLPILRNQARAQLKSYLSATNTRYGLLAVGTDPGNWEYCENKNHNWIVSIDRETFEKGINNWKPVSVDALNVSLQREQKATWWWKRIAAAFALAFVISLGSVFLAWRKPPPEPIVYITRTGKKYHTFDCGFLRKYNIEDKFAILLDKAEKDYDACGICDPGEGIE